MRRCPECHTYYEDHVDRCYVDDAELETIEDLPPVEPATPSPQASRSPVPPPMLYADLTPAPAPQVVYATPTPAPMAPPPAPSRLPWVLVGALSVLLCGGAGTWLLQVTSTPTPPVQVVQQAPAPASQPVPEPPPTIRIVVEPEGTEVFEGGQPLCTSPCVVPAGVLPRTIALSADGFQAETYTVDEPGTHRLRLRPVEAPAAEPPPPAPAPRRAARPRSAPRPASTPFVPAPQPARSLAPAPAAKAPAATAPAPAAPVPGPVRPAPRPAPEPDAFEVVDELKDPFADD